MIKNDDLPTGTLRSDLLPYNIRGGTRLFLTYDGTWYKVETRFEEYGKRKHYYDAVALYEDCLFGDYLA